MLLSTATRIMTNIAPCSRRRGIASIGWFALLLFLLPASFAFSAIVAGIVPYALCGLPR